MRTAVRLAAVAIVALGWLIFCWPAGDAFADEDYNCLVPGAQAFSSSDEEEHQPCIELGKQRFSSAVFIALPGVILLLADVATARRRTAND